MSMEPRILDNDEVLDNGLVEELVGSINLDFLGESYVKKIIMDYDDEGINDIKYDGNYLIIETRKRGKYKVVVNEQIMADINYLMEELERMNDKVLNMKNPYLDMDVMIANTPIKLRFSILHETLTNIKGVKSFCIRRNIFAMPVINEETLPPMVREDRKAIDFIHNLIDANKKPNIIVSGETGSGKTEFQKYIIGQIIPHQGVVSIQDTNDAALKKLYPEKDITEIFSNKFFNLNEGIKTALRYNPEWVIVAEIRGEEVTSFIEAMETGHSGITTIHASSGENTITRLNNLARKFGANDMYDVLEKLVDYVFHLYVLFENAEYNGKTVVVKKRVINEIYDVKNRKMVFKYLDE